MSTSESEYLYRIVSYPHAVDLFASRQLHFSAPSAWADPFETILKHRRSHALFAQCWCKKSVSDAMWKVYSPSNDSVRLRTTRSKLAAAAQAHDDANSLSFWIRDVDYMTPSQVRSKLIRLSDRLREDFTITEAAAALFIKRDAFDFENEVRVVVHDSAATEPIPATKSFRLEVDPYQLIDSIMFDPRVDTSLYQASRRHLQATLGFKGSIGKSALYRFQKQLVVE